MAEMIIESPDEVVAFLKAQHNLIEDMFDEVLLCVGPASAREAVHRVAPIAGRP